MAVLYQPWIPLRFWLGGAHAYGMRICPIRDDGRSSSSGSSNSEYEVWRRWEDCLWFQDSFELEYERMSRAKRRRLVAGKGVKKNGVYMHKDHASSFESLPPGPDPNSIAKNIHDYVPKLTKKGTLFRASQATIDQRYRELQACIDGLFKEGVPMLIQELRESRRVTDFFGYWRRDFDLALKQQKGRNHEKQPRHSISSSVFSTYFTASTPNLSTTDATLVNPPMAKSISSHKSSRSGKSLASPSSKFSGKSSGHSSSDYDFHPRRGSDSSTSSSIGPPSPPGSSHGAPSPYIVPHDIPVVFGHNPMESLPEDEEIISPLSGMKIAHDNESAPPIRRTRKNTADSSWSRDAQLYSFDENEEDLSPDNPCNRLSWQTTTSVATINPAAYLADLDTDLTLPKSPTAASHFPRGSVASFASFVSDDSANAIIPLSTQGDLDVPLSADSIRTRTFSDAESALSDQEDDLLDSYFDGALPSFCNTYGLTKLLIDAFGRPSTPTPESRPETPVCELPPSSSVSIFSSHSSNSRHGRTRSRSSTFSDFTSSDCSTISGDGSISVKVVHNKSIILLRVYRSISFADMRSKVYDKFVQQEGVPLSASFAIAFLPPAPIDYSKPLCRSSSMSSVGFPDLAHMRFISSQREWEDAIASTVRGKLTLRTIGEQGI